MATEATLLCVPLLTVADTVYEPETSGMNVIAAEVGDETAAAEPAGRASTDQL